MPDFFSTELHHPSAWTWARLLLAAPLLEEWVLRAGLQHWLALRRPRPAWFAGAASALAFAALHWRYGWPFAAGTLAPGCVMSGIYHRSRDWRLCALAHGAMNAALLLALQ
ncbi:MAG: JDVT-CTERM system glutamic-type intramembrane protease MrtJ [Telluria sp.]|jgi:membrane protease YdiL (CAAX protease family)